MATAFDEMKGHNGGVRPAYGELSRWLNEVPPDVLDYRRREAELIFRRIGITFAVYGEADAQERLIPFDVIPRIMSAAEWQLLEKGLTQRVKALNAFIKDIYGAREILRAGIVPDDLVFRNPAFRPEMSGQKRTARYLRARRRHRHRPRRRRDLLRARRQCTHALRRLLHAGEPRDHDAAVSGIVFASSHRAGRELSGRIARHAEIGRADIHRARSDRRVAHTRRLQLGLLRTLVPRRQARRRAGRRPRSLREGRDRLHAHDARPEARRCYLPAHRRRLPRSAHASVRIPHSACPD